MNPLSRLRRTLALGATGALMATGLITVAPVAQAAGDGLIINEFYGRGGSANQPYTHKFVELYNPTAAAVELDGTSLQYRSATGTGNANSTAALTGTVPAQGYFLVQLNSNGSNGEALPDPDQVTTLAPSGTTGTIFLAEGTAAINPDQTDQVIDKLGFGGSNSPEGTAAPYPGSNSTPGSLNRTGFVDTDDNAADFTFSETVTPQNSTSMPVGDHVVINEFYGRGGSANQPYTHKFVELYNPTATTFALDGTSLQYRPATGTDIATSSVDLSGTIAAGSYYLIQLSSNGSNGEALPTPDLSSTSLNPSGTTGTIFLAEGTDRINPDETDLIIDKLGFGGSNSPEGTAAPYPGSNSTPGSLNRTGFVDTDDNEADFTFSESVTPRNSGDDGGDPDPGPGPDPLELTIAEIQGTGAETPYAGQDVITEGVVTAAYPTGNFGGVYIQTPGTGGEPKTPGDASDGIFVYSGWAADNVVIGDCVSVEGVAGEYHGLTQISGNPVVTVLDPSCEAITPTPLETLPATDAEKEVYEGMLVHPEGTYTITNNYQLNQYGQLGLAVGEEPLYQATDMVRPGAEAEAYEAANLAKYITLDDGSSWDYMSNPTAQHSPMPYLSNEEPHRTGSHVTFTQPVILDYRFQWNYQPTGQVVGSDSPFDPISSENDREVEAPSVGGDIQIGAFNVLNYFTDLGQDEPGCGYYEDIYGNPVATNWCEVRGAWSQSAFEDQQAKIVTAINAMDADVLGLQEIEANSALSYKDLPRDVAIADLVGALNEAAGFTRWAYVPSPTGQVPANEDIIRTGFIYNPDTIEMVGTSRIILDDAFANARYPLVQRFRAIGTTSSFLAVNNHFKSKGSGVDDGTGQGLANPDREAQAQVLAHWVATLSRGDAAFVMGDFNAYSKETPVQILEDVGLTNLARTHEPASATYQFSGRLGSLDHVFANRRAMEMVTGAAVWDINGDEAIAFQYSRRNYNIVDFHQDDQFASSDHDPVLVGLSTGSQGNGLGVGRSNGPALGKSNGIGLGLGQVDGLGLASMTGNSKVTNSRG